MHSNANASRCSIFLCDLIPNSILLLKYCKIFCISNQHHFPEFACMQILKSCNLLSITDTCLNQRLFIFFIIGMQNGFFLKQCHGLSFLPQPAAHLSQYVSHTALDLPVLSGKIPDTTSAYSLSSPRLNFPCCYHR